MRDISPAEHAIRNRILLDFTDALGEAMEEKKVITLDLTGCKYLGELHERIRVAFDFPEWYGANLDAFDDLIGTECDAEELVIIGVNTMSEELIEYMPKIYSILDSMVAQTVNDHMLYDDIKIFSYRVVS